MLRSIRLFFEKEPKYFWISLAVMVLYGGLFFFSHSPKPASAASKDIAHFRDAAEKWNKDMNRAGAFADFAKREPVGASLFAAMTLFFIAALMTGGVLDALFVWKPAFFRKFQTDLSPPPTQAWSFSMLFKVVILFMLAGIVVSFLMGLMSALFPTWGSENCYMIFHTLILNALCVYWVVHFVKRSGGAWQDLGLRIPGTGFFREIGVGFVGYLRVLPFFAGMIAVLLAFASFFHYEPPAHPLVNVLIEEEKRAPYLMVLSVLLGTVVGPLIEEIFFRGFCYPIFRNRWGKIWGVILSAAFFAGIHHSGFVFWPVFILGVALAYLYEKRRSLVASVTLHITHNSLLIGYFFLAKRILGR